MMLGAGDIDREPDIVLVILQQVQLRAPGLSDEALRAIELDLRATYGGMRFRVAKRKKHPTPEQRQRIFDAALTNAPTEQITSDEGIHRSTLYRYLKRDHKNTR